MDSIQQVFLILYCVVFVLAWLVFYLGAAWFLLGMPKIDIKGELKLILSHIIKKFRRN